MILKIRRCANMINKYFVSFTEEAALSIKREDEIIHEGRYLH